MVFLISQQRRTTKYTKHAKRESNNLQSLLSRPCEDRFISDLNDRPLKKSRELDDILDDFARRRIRAEPELFGFWLAFSNYFEGRKAEFQNQLSERLLSKRFFKIIDPFRVDAVFTKQLSQVSARRSGRFFVDGDFVFCHVRH